MNSLSLLAALLAAGWWFYRRLLLTRYEALHHPGHPQYFGAALCAVYLFVMAAAARELAAGCLMYTEVAKVALERIPTHVGNKESLVELSRQAEVTAFALLGAWLLPMLFNWPLRSKKLRQTIARKKGALDQLEELAIKCDEEELLCALTLDNGKVYLGIPEGFSWPGVGRDWLALFPVASGYRTPEGQLELTTYYDDYLTGAESGDSNRGKEAFRIVIATAQVRNAQSFDLKVYRTFRQPPPPQLLLTEREMPLALPEESANSGNTEPSTSPTFAGDWRRYRAYLATLVTLSIALPLATWRPGLAGGVAWLGLWLGIYAANYLHKGEK